MSETAPSLDPADLQRARALYLFSTLLEPWSDRRIAARTGIGKNAVGKRRIGQTPLSMSDIELLAPLARMTPEELFKELREVKLPHLDSNQEPIGSKPEQLGELVDISRQRRIKRPTDPTTSQTGTAVVTSIEVRTNRSQRA